MSPRTIWKFPVPLQDFPVINMPQGAEILQVFNEPGDGTYIHARVDPNALTLPRKFRLAGTGHRDVSGDYVGSVSIRGSVAPLWFHLFDLGAE